MDYDSLIFEYLTHNGYQNTATSFISECKQLRKPTPKLPRTPASRGSTEIYPLH